MDDALRERVEALERAVTDGDHDLSTFADEAEAVDRLETLESDVADLADQIEELEAATQALRGYVGNVRSVNTDVEQRADAALARVEALESRLPGDADGRQPAAGDDTTRRDDPESDGAAGTVDEWEWGTDDSTEGERADESGSHGSESGGAQAGDGRVTLGGAGRSSEAPGAGGGARPQERAPGSEQSSAGAATGRHAVGRGHADAGRCASCGRPRDTDSTAESDQPPDTPDTATGQPTATRDGQRVPVSGSGQPATGQVSAGGGSMAGAPTVAAVAEHDPGGTDPEGSHGEDGDVLPDGADDPLVGTAGEDGGTGTLQRIRDLL